MNQYWNCTLSELERAAWRDNNVLALAVLDKMDTAVKDLLRKQADKAKETPHVGDAL